MSFNKRKVKVLNELQIIPAAFSASLERWGASSNLLGPKAAKKSGLWCEKLSGTGPDAGNALFFLKNPFRELLRFEPCPNFIYKDGYVPLIVQITHLIRFPFRAVRSQSGRSRRLRLASGLASRAVNRSC